MVIIREGERRYYRVSLNLSVVKMELLLCKQRTLRRSGQGQRRKNQASVMAWKPLDEDISRRGYEIGRASCRERV